MFISQIFIILFLILCVAGIVLSFLASSLNQGKILSWIGCAAAFVIFLAGCSILITGNTFTASLWYLSGIGNLKVTVDHLSSIFLIISGLVLFPASIFAGSSSAREPRRQDERAFNIMMFALYASIILIFIAGDVVFFLLTWEMMSIFCWLLIVSARNRKNTNIRSGYLLLTMGEVGTITVVIAFIILSVHANSMNFTKIQLSAVSLNKGALYTAFLLSFFGFGIKAGLVPVNFWLPRAYTEASRAFVPVLAGATLNLGLYGILRVNAVLLPASPVILGLIVLVIGTVSALIGILYATTENDLKTMLAHSSIENAGIIIAGFGAGMVFVTTKHPALAAIAFVAALYHLINHSLYKTLLFCGAGTIEAQTGMRNMDKLGGLIKWMPVTAVVFLVGTLSIAALPPFNGFVSEWLMLQTMLRSSELSSTAIQVVFALCGVGLALTAALAVTCFVKVFAMSFLGMHRSRQRKKVKEAKSGMIAPMAILAALCILFGILPTYVIPALNTATKTFTGASASTALVPPFYSSSPDHKTLPSDFVKEFHGIGAQVGQDVLPGRGLVVMHRGGKENPVVFAMSTSYAVVMILLLLALTFIIVRLWLTKNRNVTRKERWAGGMRQLLPEMTYTATGFSNPVRVVFDAIFRPTTVEDTRETVAEHFRTAIKRKKANIHPVDKIIYYPLKKGALWLAKLLASMHHGKINAYSAYILITLLIVLIINYLF